MFKKLIKVLAPIAITGVILAGCGHPPLHHATHTAQRYAVHNTSHHKHANKTKPNQRLANQESNNNFQNTDCQPITSENPSQQSNAKNSTYLDSNPSVSRPSVYLGHGVTGLEDRGAGQVYIGFEVNGQHYLSHGNDVDESSNSAVNNAKGIVNNLYNK